VVIFHIISVAPDKIYFVTLILTLALSFWDFKSSKKCYLTKLSWMFFLKFVDIDRLTYSALPPDNGIGEGSWSGLCFSPNQISMVSSSSNGGSLYIFTFHVKERPNFTCSKMCKFLNKFQALLSF
jgi:hypothetical protein